jgi:hypothetical protein
MDPHEQTAPNHAGRVKFGEIFLLKSARFQQHHRQRVTQRQHHRRAGGRRQVQGTCFLFNVHIEKDVRVLCQSGIGVTANRDDLHLKARDRRQNPQQFLGLAARAQRQNGVTVCHHSEIAVQGIKGIEHDRGRTGAGEGCGDFAADVSRLSHPQNDNFSARINRRFQQFDRVTETFAETLPQSLQLKDLDFEHACGLFKVVHRNIIEPEHETGQDSSLEKGSL